MAADRPNRVRRVGEGIRVELASLLGAEVKDPSVAGVILTRVEMTPDLRSARVYVRLLQGGDDAEGRANALAGLRRAAGLLRREVTHRLGLRYAPELRFEYDAGLERASRIDALLAEIEAERRSR